MAEGCVNYAPFREARMGPLCPIAYRGGGPDHENIDGMHCLSPG